MPSPQALQRGGSRLHVLLPTIQIAVVLLLLASPAQAIIPLPFIFKKSASSTPAAMDVRCSFGDTIDIPAPVSDKSVICGTTLQHAWKVWQETGSGAGGSELDLGPQANQQKLSLVLSPKGGQGAWRRVPVRHPTTKCL